jgi:hypothetical protein
VVLFVGFSLRRSYEKEIIKIRITISFCRNFKKSKDVKEAKIRLRAIVLTLVCEIKQKEQ